MFEQTGIQMMPINTLYQMMSLVERKSPLLDIAATFLTIPDLLNYWLTGVKVCEFTNATTTQMLNPRTRRGRRGCSTGWASRRASCRRSCRRGRGWAITKASR